jgi:hypothetical protein
MFRRALILLIVALPLLPSITTADVGWTLSASSTDPLVNNVSAAAGTHTVYLWLYCSYPPSLGGISRTKLGLYASAPEPIIVVSEFVPKPGVVNSGSAADVDLLISGCPPGAHLVGHFVVESLHDNFDLCLGTGVQHPSYGCAAPTVPVENEGMGYNVGLGKPCVSDFLFFAGCRPTVAVESYSWGRVKALYEQ